MKASASSTFSTCRRIVGAVAAADRSWPTTHTATERRYFTARSLKEEVESSARACDRGPQLQSSACEAAR
eukprot:CAMPEP_0118840314 /NCGR_PEP_ID=MMETSP1162-20130426/72462_1 /TAXON_ID=33656 /ORGANISM="Phaeocystis Sp, Strain CCMP2710" /LENGTH=69 /DNA_ID=CAMNT_0006772319 /DNA_START=270 /DNA_END=476 /DNA_ORIENTATION=+